MSKASSIHYFPVRHHSPRTSLVLRAFLDAHRPKLVLVEGPADAGPMIQPLLDSGTVPPVAILGYRTDGTPGSALWPFASYSPEYQALLWAKAQKAEARFIDITVKQSLAESAEAKAAAQLPATPDDGSASETADKTPEPEDEGDDDGEVDDGDDDEDGEPDVWLEAAKRRGYRSFEEMWEADFEAPAYQSADFQAALIAWADAVRMQPSRRAGFHRARDAVMKRHIESALSQGFAPHEIVCVAGAAHVAALVIDDVDLAAADRFGAGVEAATTLIPFSFTRLAGQTGYGAGNRAPRFYQRVFDHQGNTERATLEMLVEVGDHLRLLGHNVSLADTIEAYRLASMLAQLRNKQGPGLDEVREAVLSAMCRGDATWVDKFLWPMVVGHAIGSVSAQVGKNSLQEEFWREVKARRLPQRDEPEDFLLKMSDPTQVGTSIFLHRLRVLDVPYASYLGSQTQRVSNKTDFDDDAGGISALTRAKESWQAQWTPSTDVALVEKVVLGDSIAEVTERVLTDQLRQARTTGAAADVLLEAIVCDASRTAAESLQLCEMLSSADEDLVSLARATRAVSGLVAFGTTRAFLAGSDAVLRALAEKTFVRACLRAPLACVGNDEAVAPVKTALRTLHEVAIGSVFLDRALWLDVAKKLRDLTTIHPGCSGLAAGLLWLAGELSEEQVAHLVGFRLSSALEPQEGAMFLEGFLEVNALVLVRSRPVVSALDAFVQSIPADRVKDLLPVLRRAFAVLGATERRYLLENVLALRVSAEKAQAGKALIDAKDAEQVKEIAKDVGKLMDDLDDLL